MSERLRGGARPAEVLREFHVPPAEWPHPTERWEEGQTAGEAAEGSGAAEAEVGEAALSRLASFLHGWVTRCREREEAASAFAAAEYVEVSPAFADCTGRCVQLSFPREPGLASARSLS